MVTASPPTQGGAPPATPVERRAAASVLPPAAATLTALFMARVDHSPDAVAYRWYDEPSAAWRDMTWGAAAAQAARWQAALAAEGLACGDRVAVMLRNRPEWVMFDQAALGLGLVVVPLYTNDRPDNVAYILDHSGARLLLVEHPAQWREMETACGGLARLRRVVSLQPLDAPGGGRLTDLRRWLPRRTSRSLQDLSHGGDVATIVYTSGTTGRPKGVMLSHANILWNARSALEAVTVSAADAFLSFLPLSHMLERTIGYYLPMMAGASVAYSRSISLLAEDLMVVRPTILISVPRVFERVYARIQLRLQRAPASRRLFELAVGSGWRAFEYRQGRRGRPPLRLVAALLDRLVGRGVRAGFGGRLRLAVCGGAPLCADVARPFIALGVPIIQGYGMTEAGPVVSTNRLECNDPASVGPPLNGVQVAIGAQDELLVKGPAIMAGYWRDAAATAAAVDGGGWLHTGDTARLHGGAVYITGRLKDIVVMSNGEKVPHGDMEAAIAQDPLFEQVLVVGDGRPYLCALAVVEARQWRELAVAVGCDPDTPGALAQARAVEAVLARIGARLRTFPGYAQVRRVAVLREPWTVGDGLLTPTLKLRRGQILERFAATVEQLYDGH